MNVGDPNDRGKSAEARESDMPVVVKIPEKVKAGGAKGHYYRSNFSIIDQTELMLEVRKTLERKSKVSCSKRRRRQYCRKSVNITGETISESQARARV